MEGEYGGLGIYITSRDGRTIVIAPIENTPADRVGLKPLDEIIKVDEKNVIGMTSDEVVKLLRGPAGKPVKIGVRRKNVDKLLEFNIVREIINIKTVRLEMLGGKIAYIKFNQFNLKTDIELESILNYAKKEKATGILLDLRNNPGGLLNICVDVTSRFIDGGVVVGMKGRFDKANDTLYAAQGKATKTSCRGTGERRKRKRRGDPGGSAQGPQEGDHSRYDNIRQGSVQSLFNLPDNSGHIHNHSTLPDPLRECHRQ